MALFGRDESHHEHGSAGNGTTLYGSAGEYPDPSPFSSGFIIAHVLMMIAATLVLLPIGSSLGFTRSRSHAPVQLTATVLLLLGALMPTFSHMFGGHAHGELKTIGGHRFLGSILVLLILTQGIIGFMVRAIKHARRTVVDGWQAAYNSQLRSWNVPAEAAFRFLKKFHHVTGRLMFVVPYFVVIWGIVGANGWCVEEPRHLTGQCAAHFIKGPTFVFLGVLYTLQNLGRLRDSFPLESREFYEGIALGVWGVVALVSEHRSFDRVWNHTDQQHTAIGVYWVLGSFATLAFHGLKRARQSRSESDLPSVNIFPATTLWITGVQMSLHDVQITGFSQTVHKFFGMALLIGSTFRIVALTAAPKVDFVVPTFVICAGLFLLSATEESIAFLISIMVDPVSFAAALAGLALFIQAWVIFLVRLRESGDEQAAQHDPSYGTLPEADERAVPLGTMSIPVVEAEGSDRDVFTLGNKSFDDLRYSFDKEVVRPGSESSSLGTAH